MSNVPYIVAITTLLSLLLSVGMWIGMKIKRINNLIDDFFGEEERPGVPRRPGIMERLQAIENKLNESSNIDAEKINAIYRKVVLENG